MAKDEKESDVDQSFVSDSRSEAADLPSEREEPRSEDTVTPTTPHDTKASVALLPVCMFVCRQLC
ncbi:unnamed protein product [Strongylus vulgaris]|nr:unnamed protein product [Strongylus vulgaris]